MKKSSIATTWRCYPESETRNGIYLRTGTLAMDTTEIDRDFLRRIRRDPDDDSIRLTYADYLEDRRRPARAELIRVQCLLDRLPSDEPNREDLQHREKDLLDRYDAEWSSDIQSIAAGWQYRRGFIEYAAVRTDRFAAHGGELLQKVPIRRIRLLQSKDWRRHLSKCPHLDELRELDFSGWSEGDPLAELLAQSTRLGGLRELDLGFTDLTEAGIGHLARSGAFGSLAALRLTADPRIGATGLRSLGSSRLLPELRCLGLSQCGLNHTALHEFAESAVGTQLDGIELDGNNLDSQSHELLAGSLIGRMLDRRQALSIRRSYVGFGSLEALVRNPSVDRLVSLDLEQNPVRDVGVEVLAARSPASLGFLNLSSCGVTDLGIMALARSPLARTLRFLDLEGNLVTAEAIRRFRIASTVGSSQPPAEVRIDCSVQARPAMAYSRRFMVSTNVTNVRTVPGANARTEPGANDV